MIILSIVYVLFSFCLLSSDIHCHILVLAPPLFSHVLPSLELAKQLSSHCHVTFLIPTNNIKELEYKGFITTFRNMSSLDIIGLNDGNNASIEYQVQDSQIHSNNITSIIANDHQTMNFNTMINRTSSTLEQLFHSLPNNCSSIEGCSLKLSSVKSLTTRPISQPIKMIIVRSITPLPSLDPSIPVYMFLPSNLRGVTKYLHATETNTSQPNGFLKYLRKNIDRANGFICNSLEEFDQEYIDEFYRVSRNPASIHFVGPIVFHNPMSIDNKTKDIIDWLDKQPSASVIYIAFGSVARLPPTAIDMIAHALSPHAFIWSLKMNQSLPLSLMNLDSNRQLVLEWTPQRAILAHPSIVLFFSHGGWNSLLEGMLHGKAMLLWPFFGDQFDNVLQLVDMGISRQISTDLQTDFEHMLTNNSYANRAKQIQQLVIKAQETNSKKQIAAIVRSISGETKERNEL